MYICAYIYIYIYIYIYYTHMYTHVHTCMYIHTYAHTHIQTHTHIHTHTYTHTHIHTQNLLLQVRHDEFEQSPDMLNKCLSVQAMQGGANIESSHHSAQNDMYPGRKVNVVIYSNTASQSSFCNPSTVL